MKVNRADADQDEMLICSVMSGSRWLANAILLTESA